MNVLICPIYFSVDCKSDLPCGPLKKRNLPLAHRVVHLVMVQRHGVVADRQSRSERRGNGAVARRTSGAVRSRHGFLLRALNHVHLDITVVGLDVIENVIFDQPLEKIELSDRCLDKLVLVVVVVDPEPSSEWVELMFGVRFELRPVVDVHVKVPVRVHVDDDGVFFCIIGDKPIDYS